MNVKILRIIIGILSVWSIGFAQAVMGQDDRYLIRPGVGIGSIKIGMSETDPLLKKVHAPTRVTVVAHGITVKRWLSSAPLPPHIQQDKALLGNYLTIFFQKGKVVQIEVSSESFHTPSGLTTANSANDFQKLFTHVVGSGYQRNIVGDTTYSLPAAKHFVAYEDAYKAGIAWKYGTWGSMGPEPDPSAPMESLIVHVKGKPVICDPNDALPYSGTWPLTK